MPFTAQSKSDGQRKLDEWSKAYDNPYNGNVYHYTSLAAFSGILGSRSVFCTDYRQLNDTTELSLGFEVLEAIVSARATDIGVPESDVGQMLERLASLRRACFHMSMFCGSFSLRRNDLAQWRAYAPRDGVSIGFHEESLARVAKGQHFVCGAVRYLGAPLFREWLSAQLESMRDGFQQMANNEAAARQAYVGMPKDVADLTIQSQRAGNIERSAGEMAGLLKHPDFRSEQEWRCVFVLRDNTLQPRKQPKYRCAGTGIARYVELELLDLNGLVREIIVGPGSDSDRIVQMVADLCRANGLTAPVELPKHPLRT